MLILSRLGEGAGASEAGVFFPLGEGGSGAAPQAVTLVNVLPQRSERAQRVEAERGFRVILVTTKKHEGGPVTRAAFVEVLLVRVGRVVARRRPVRIERADPRHRARAYARG